jgi:hypothetical protein
LIQAQRDLIELPAPVLTGEATRELQLSRQQKGKGREAWALHLIGKIERNWFFNIAISIEVGNIGAYGRVMASHFNGYGYYDEVILEDEPLLSMYAGQSDEEVISAAV